MTKLRCYFLGACHAVFNENKIYVINITHVISSFINYYRYFFILIKKQHTASKFRTLIFIEGEGSTYLFRKRGYTKMGPPTPCLRIFWNTSRSNSTILDLDTNRFSQGCGASHEPLAIASSSARFTRSKNSM